MPQRKLSLRFIIIATVLGNTLEWYDIAIFRFLSHIMAKIFFPGSTELKILIHTALIYGFGSILRPVGGIIFGYVGDRYGRRIVLITSILLMAIPMLLVTILPTYQQIGVTATVLFLLFRISLGLSAGAELPGAITFLIESSPREKRGFFGSFAYFGIALGIFLGGLDFFFVNKHLSNESVIAWGWRFMFFFGFLLGSLAFFLRRKLHDTPIYQEIRKKHEVLPNPVKILLKFHKKGLLQLIGVEMLETLGFNLLFIFSSIYYISVMNFSRGEAMLFNLLFLSLLLVMIPIFGLVASQIGPKKLAFYSACAFFLFSAPLHWMLQHTNLHIFYPIGTAILLASYMAPIPAVYCDLFPARVRMSGIGIGLNIPIALIGGFSPLFALSSIEHTGLKIAPALFLMIGALISLATLRTIKTNLPE